MAGVVFLADFHGWTAQQAAEAYMFRTDGQYALNLEPGAEVWSRTVERYQKLFRQDDTAAQIFSDVTKRLIEKLDLDVSRRRLDSTHVFSQMATFGRTKLMAVAIKRFLTQVKRHDPQVYAVLREPFRLRYEPAQSEDNWCQLPCRVAAPKMMKMVLDWVIVRMSPALDRGRL